MKLTKKEIGYIATKYKDATSISIFKNILDKPEGNEKLSLEKKGILVDGKINNEASEIFSILANAKKSTRLLLQNPDYVLERYSYKSANKMVLATNDNGDLKFSISQDFSDVIVEISEFIGMSKIALSNLSLILNPDEMLVLLFLLDSYRKQFLQQYSGLNSPIKSISELDLVKEMKSDYKNGLAQVLVNSYNFIIPDNTKLSTIIKSLIEKKLILEEKGYRLNDELEIIAKNFLILENLILYETFETQKDDTLLTIGRLVVSAGIHNLMSFMFDGDNIQLDMVSGLQLVTNIEDFLMCPDLENDIIKEDISQTNDDTWLCSCGKTNTSNFCSNCGAKRP